MKYDETEQISIGTKILRKIIWLVGTGDNTFTFMAITLIVDHRVNKFDMHGTCMYMYTNCTK